MKILSLFDGMSCGMIALMLAGVEVETYDAYEIDQYAVTVSQYNFPKIKHHGDVFKADFTKYQGYDFLLGGSPCTYWSIAQSPDRRETTASGIGWELFSQYVKALHQIRPKYFIYENNKSMSKDIRHSIDEAFGFKAVCINSALVSAQNRQRLYWVGRLNEDGTYSKVNVQQPKDRGILLKDILENGQDLCSNNKAYTLTASYNGACPWNTIERNQRTMIANVSDGLPDRIRQVGVFPTEDGRLNNAQAMRIYDSDAKGVSLKALAGGMGAKTGLYAMETNNSNNKPVYEVKDGCITINNKKYPIKLKDGYYVIRKLTIRECMRLQTIPEWFDFSCISKAQSYKMLGNGWTVEVIKHLILACLSKENTELTGGQIVLFDIS